MRGSRLFALAAGLMLAASVSGGLRASKVQIVDEEYRATTPGAAASDASLDPTQWYNRITLSGFANAGFVQTGANGAEPEGHFYASERELGSMLFLDATLSDDISLHNEFYLYNQALGLKQLYIEVRNPAGGEGLLSLRIGRIDIPFGEEYLWQNADDNPMILRTAAWPWGYSQGLLLFGRLGLFRWIVSGMDGQGSASLSTDNGTGKSFVSRLSLDPATWLHLSASGIKDGEYDESALTFNGNPLTPLGATSLASGPSTSSTVAFEAGEGDLVLKLGRRFRLRGDYGMVSVADRAPYDRTFSYYYGEAKFDLTRTVYLVGRYSAIGTFDPKKGYEFGGDYDNATDFNDDVESLTRAGGAIGWNILDNLVWKVEGDNDTVQLIDAARLAGLNQGASRWTAASEFVAKF